MLDFLLALNAVGSQGAQHRDILEVVCEEYPNDLQVLELLFD